MPESPPYSDTREPADAPPERAPTTGMPRWVKMSAIVVVVLVVLVIVMLLVGGDHGPSRH